jgi:MipA family protein
MIIELQSRITRLLVQAPAIVLGATFATTTAVGLVHPAIAQDIGDIGAIETPVYTPDPASPSWRYRVGLGLALAPDYVGSDDYRFVPLPQFSASKGPQYVALTGGYLSSNVLPSQNWRLGPTAKYIRGDRCNAQDNRVNDQKCQADALMLGATGGYAFTFKGLNDENANLTPTLEVLGDVAGANEGVTIEPQLNYAQRLSDRWQMALRGFATFGSEDYERYYFGVNGTQSRASGLSQHDADGGFQQVGLLGVFDYDLTDHWRLSFVGRYMRMVGDAEDSPLVDGDDGRGSANQWVGGAIVSYGW